VHRVRLRGEDVHRVADDDGRRFERVGDAELQRPLHLEVLDVVGVDLVEGAVVPALVVAVGHGPLAGVARHAEQLRVGEGAGRDEQQREDGSHGTQRAAPGARRGSSVLQVRYLSGTGFRTRFRLLATKDDANGLYQRSAATSSSVTGPKSLPQESRT